MYANKSSDKEAKFFRKKSANQKNLNGADWLTVLVELWTVLKKLREVI
jgi:hypothetical protein